MTLNASVPDDQLGRFYRKTSAIADRLDKSLPFEQVMEALQLIHDGKFADAQITRVTKPKTRLLTPGLVIPATDGTENLSDPAVFQGWVDSDLANWGCNGASEARPETTVAVHELFADATFQQIFGGQGVDLDRLCLTPHQIKQFVITHRDYLHPQGYATFFLFKVGESFFVAHVYWFDARRLKVYVDRLSFDNAWDAGSRHRVVLPQTL